MFLPSSPGEFISRPVSKFLLFFLNWSIMSGAILSIAGTIYQGHRRVADILKGKKVLSYEFFSAVVCTIMSSATLGYCWRGLSILLFSFINQVDFSCQKWAIFLCNKQNNTWLFSDIKISLLVFVLEFCGFPNCLDRGKCRKLLYAAQSNSGNCSV